MAVRVFQFDWKGLRVMDHFLVECPGCGGCAEVRWAGHDEKVRRAKRRLVCSSCGLVRERPDKWCGYDSSWKGLDPLMGLPLWLREACCGEVLWAYNHAHLNFIKEYVGADLRPRERGPSGGWCNNSLPSRLPEWIVVGKHREEVLKAIGRIEEKRGRG